MQIKWRINEEEEKEKKNCWTIDFPYYECCLVEGIGNYATFLACLKHMTYGSWSFGEHI